MFRDIYFIYGVTGRGEYFEATISKGCLTQNNNSQHKMSRSINRFIVQWVNANAQASQKHQNKSMHSSSLHIAQIQHNKSMDK
jgi:hypothetical protein